MTVAQVCGKLGGCRLPRLPFPIALDALTIHPWCNPSEVIVLVARDRWSSKHGGPYMQFIPTGRN